MELKNIQTIGHAHCLGQEKEVHVYELLAHGTMDVLMSNFAKSQDEMLSALITKHRNPGKHGSHSMFLTDSGLDIELEQMLTSTVTLPDQVDRLEFDGADSDDNMDIVMEQSNKKRSKTLTKKDIKDASTSMVDRNVEAALQVSGGKVKTMVPKGKSRKKGDEKTAVEGRKETKASRDTSLESGLDMKHIVSTQPRSMINIDKGVFAGICVSEKDSHKVGYVLQGDYIIC